MLPLDSGAKVFFDYVLRPSVSPEFCRAILHFSHRLRPGDRPTWSPIKNPALAPPKAAVLERGTLEFFYTNTSPGSRVRVLDANVFSMERLGCSTPEASMRLRSIFSLSARSM
jgi:hypothetical protein